MVPSGRTDGAAADSLRGPIDASRTRLGQWQLEPKAHAELKEGTLMERAARRAGKGAPEWGAHHIKPEAFIRRLVSTRRFATPLKGDGSVA